MSVTLLLMSVTFIVFVMTINKIWLTNSLKSWLLSKQIQLLTGIYFVFLLLFWPQFCKFLKSECPRVALKNFDLNTFGNIYFWQKHQKKLVHFLDNIIFWNSKIQKYWKFMKIIVIVIDFDIMSLTFLSKSQTSIQIVMTLVKF